MWGRYLAAAAALMLVTAADGGQTMASTHYRAEIGAQDPHKTVTLDGIAISYSDSGGTGPVILCLHAIGHGARDFEDLSRRLAPRYRMIALDFPGQGKSGADAKPASGTRYTELLTLFIDKLALDHVTLLGNSIGGATAVRYAHLHPERVRALVLCDSGGLGGPPDERSKGYIASFVQLFQRGADGDPGFAREFDDYYRKVLIEPSAQPERERIVRAAYETAPILVQAWESFARPEESLRAFLPDIQCPVLLAWAHDDVILPLAGGEDAAKLLPRSRVEVFKGGHAAFLEDPDRFEEALRQFLPAV